MRLAPFSRSAAADPLFAWRGGDVSRLEALSDGVFAITISLLVISLEVPANFSALQEVVAQLPVFLVSFLILMAAWRAHFLFFRRFGLDDGATQWLNALFLFLVLFCAFPLKFMASFLWALITGTDVGPMFATDQGPVQGAELAEQRAQMMLFLCWGVIGLFGSLSLLNLRAWNARLGLKLNAVECALTLSGLVRLMVPVLVACLAWVVVAAGAQPGVAGICFFLIAPMLAGHAIWSRMLVKRAMAQG